MKTEEAMRGNNSVYWSIIGVVFGIIGIVTSILLPVVGVIFSAIGLIMGFSQRKKMNYGWAKKAIIISVIGLIIGVIMWTASAYLIAKALNSAELNPDILSQIGAQ